MVLLVNLLVCAAAAFTMYRIVERHNAKVLRELPPEEAIARSVHAGGAAVGTAALAIVAVPIIFGKMYGRIGILYGFAFVFAMTVCSTMTTAAVALVVAITA